MMSFFDKVYRYPHAGLKLSIDKLIAGVILYFSFIVYRFVSTFYYQFPTLEICHEVVVFTKNLCNGLIIKLQLAIAQL